MTDWREAEIVEDAKDWQAAPIVSDEDPSILDGVGRGVGLTARNALELPGNIADFGANVLNVPINLLHRADAALSGRDEVTGAGLPTNSAAFISNKLTELGLPTAETPLERVGTDIQKATATAALPIKVGGQLQASTNPVTRGVGETLAANPAIQGTSAVTGSGAGGTVRESGGTEGQELAANIAGSLSPSVAVTTGPALVRGGFRGTNAQGTQEVVDTFARSGTTPTVGQATGGRIAQATESLLSRAPGGSGRIAATAQQQTDDVAKRVEEIADSLSPKATAERAGRAIEVGITGDQGFVRRFQGTASKLYDDVDEFVDTDGLADLSGTRRFLAEKTAPVAGAEETSQLLSSKFLDDVAQALNADLSQSAGLPYSTVKALRSKVGEKISSLSLVDDASKADLKRLYGALSDDLSAFAATQGDEAVRAVKRADAFYRSGMGRIENLERVVNKAGGPEKIFNAALSGTKEGATTLRTIMKSLQPAERKMVAAAVVRRMGKATPGQQDATGEAFSINTYLTNWARLSPEARGTLFGRFGKKFNDDMKALSEFASNVRDGSDVFRNPSGTQQALSLQGTTGGAAFAALMGRYDVATSIIGVVAASNLSARLMTNPRFVRWLAVQTKLPEGAAPAQLQTLTRLAADDRDIAEFVALLQEHENQGEGRERE